MNENDGGTPNPLNSNPFDSGPSEPAGGVEEIQVTESAGVSEYADGLRSAPRTRASRVQISEPASSQTADLEPLAANMVEESVLVESLDPEGRPMEKALETTPKPKKKKTGLVVGLVLSLFVAVGCGVAAVLLLLNSPKDPVVEAMKKIMSGEAPSNVIIDGDIKFAVNDPNSIISNVNISLDAKAKTSSMINTSSAEVELVFSDNDKLTFQFDEVYAANGDLYFKIDGVSDLTEKMVLLQTQSRQTNCISDESGETNCVKEPDCDCPEGGVCDCLAPIEIIAEEGGLDEMTTMLTGVVSVIEGEWLKVSIDELTSMSGEAQLGSDTSCIISLIDSINTNSNSAAELYNKNPFISSTTENITVMNKFNQVRQITIDDKAFANFVNSIQNAKITEKLYSCLGWDDNVAITEEDVAEVVRKLPAVYVEIDQDNNFSRFYMVTQTEDGTGTITIDLSFSYPANINVPEPVKYMTFEDAIQEIMMSIYDIDDITIEVDE